MIMIVEDNEGMRTEIRKVLHFIEPQNEIYECTNGEEAVEAYSRLLPSIVLMDIEMGEMDGLIATEVIRRSFPAAKIVIVTNFDDPDLRHAALQAGAIGYVLKDNLIDIKQFIGPYTQ